MIDTSTPGGALADQRLRDEQIIWLTTVRADGQPQSVPVWFLWDGTTLLIYSRPAKPKLDNLRTNPRVALHLNSDPVAAHMVRLQGRATIDPAIPPATRIPAFIDKYHAEIARLGMTPASFAAAYSVPIRVTPTWFYAR